MQGMQRNTLLCSARARRHLSQLERTPATTSGGRVVRGTLPRPEGWGHKESRSFASAALGKGPDSQLSTAECTFVVKELFLTPGECVKVVGAPPELGAWKVSAAPALQRQGNAWSVTARPSLTTFEFKLVVEQETHAAEPRWENGTNRVVQVEAGQRAQVICQFDDPASTQLVFQTPGPEEDAAEPSPVNAGEGSAAASPASSQKEVRAAKPDQAAEEEHAPLVHHAVASAGESAADAASKPDLVQPARPVSAAAGVEMVWQTAGGGSLTVLPYADDD